MNNTQRKITRYTKGVRCGHCGERSKIGEIWLLPGKDYINNQPICYGHKECVEKAIEQALKEAGE